MTDYAGSAIALSSVTANNVLESVHLLYTRTSGAALDTLKHDDAPPMDAENRQDDVDLKGSHRANDPKQLQRGLQDVCANNQAIWILSGQASESALWSGRDWIRKVVWGRMNVLEILEKLNA